MTTLRRAYLYGVSFVSLHVALWTAVGLGQLAVNPPGVGGLSRTWLAGLLSTLIVATPFYLLHWLLAQRLAARETAEREAGLRGLYLRLVMASTAVPALVGAVQLLESPLRWALGEAEALDVGMMLSRAVLVLFAGTVWAYAARQAMLDGVSLQEGGTRATIHRAYRFFMLGVGLSMLAAGALSLLVMVLQVGVVGARFWQSRLATALALILVATPLWLRYWGEVQRAFAAGGEEAHSTLRKAYLYLVTLIGVVSVISAGAAILNQLLRGILGEPAYGEPLLGLLARPIAVAVVGGVLWAFHARALAADAAALPEAPTQAAVRRLYHHLVSALGLGATLAGALMLVGVVGSALEGAGQSVLRPALSEGLAVLTAGLPVWLIAWARLQEEAATPGEAGDDARRSLVRRGYLYLFAFVGAVGLLGTVALLLNVGLRSVLGVPQADPLAKVARWGLGALIFAGLLAHQFRAIRADVEGEGRSRAASLAAYPVAVIGPERWRRLVTETLGQTLPGAPLHEAAGEDPAPALAQARAALLPSSVLLDASPAASRSLMEFEGLRLVFPTDAAGWYWVGCATGALRRQIQRATRLMQSDALGRPPRAGWPTGGWVNVGLTLLALVLILWAAPLFFWILGSALGGFRP